mgnify:CR=1 FL=1
MMGKGTNPARVLGKLRNWERNGDALDGVLYGHPVFADGQDHTTSVVRYTYTRGSKRYVRCLSCTYELDGPGDERGELFFAQKLQSTDERIRKGNVW